MTTVAEHNNFNRRREENISWNIFLESNRIELSCFKLREEIKKLKRENNDPDWNEYIDMEYHYGDAYKE